MRIAFFVSGGGSNMQSVIDAVNSGDLVGVVPALVVSHRTEVYALERAKKYNIPFVVIEKNYPLIATIIRAYHIDLIMLSGYLGILPPDFVREFKGKIVNIHPSLIPNFCGHGMYGMRVHEAVVRAGAKESGATVHFVDEGVDTGKIILQDKVPVLSSDTPADVAHRVQELEYKLLPRAIKKLSEEQR